MKKSMLLLILGLLIMITLPSTVFAERIIDNVQYEESNSKGQEGETVIKGQNVFPTEDTKKEALEESDGIMEKIIDNTQDEESKHAGNGRTIETTTSSSNLNYDDPCNTEGMIKSMRILGHVLNIVKMVVPFLIIVFGIIDFTKAVTSSDESAINKAAEALVRRIIAGIIIVILPTLLLSLTDFFGMTSGVASADQTTGFGKCVTCLLAPNSRC